MEAASRDLDRREMLAEIKKLCRPDNFTNWFVLGREYAVLAVTIGICLASYQWMLREGVSLWWMTPIYAATVLVVGGWTQNRLAVLIHESSHYMLFRNRLLNELAANLLVAFPLFAVMGNYRGIHWAHHRHVNDPEHDPDLQRLAQHQPRDFPISRTRFFWEYVVAQLSPLRAISYLRGRAKYAVVPVGNRQSDANFQWLSPQASKLLRRVYLVTLAVVLTWFGWWPEFWLLWMAPMFTVYPAVLFLREIAHHGNYPDNGDFTNSRVYEGRWLEREIFFPFSEQNHVLHHMFPTIPWHKMRDAHAVMLRYEPYRDNVVICDGFFVRGTLGSEYPSVLDVLTAPSHAYLHSKKGVPDAVPDSIRQISGSEVGRTAGLVSTWSHGES
jgi:fatty acid desaturase